MAATRIGDAAAALVMVACGGWREGLQNAALKAAALRLELNPGRAVLPAGCCGVADGAQHY